MKFRYSLLSKFITASLIGIVAVFLVGLIIPVLSVEAAQVEVFEQVWETVNENFYDPSFNGADWQAMRQKYRSQVEQAQSQAEFATVVNQMLAELNTSHTHFYTANESAYYQILGIFQPQSEELQQQLESFFPGGKIEYSGIGIFTKKIEGKTFVSAILDGSPAAESDLQVGDELLSVEGRPFEPIQSFVSKAGQEVTLTVRRSPPSPNSTNSAALQEIEITPQMLDATTMFLNAMDASIQVIERDDKQIGYVHIWSYAGDQYQQKLEEELLFGRLKDADALVLDLRDGWGGANPTYLNLYAAHSMNLTSTQRDGQLHSFNSSWSKPIVMLVNEGSRSGKEILAYGFQEYQLGTVVGSRTAGAVVGGTLFIMDNGSTLYLAVYDVLVDGDRLEGVGVTPDIVVPFSLKYAQGADPQKDRAVEVALETTRQ